MSIYFISDLHLEDTNSNITHAFFNFIDGLKENDQLYILGDLFESWVGDDDSTELSNSVAEKLRSLSDRNISTAIMHGNRDFLIGDLFCHSASIKLLEDPYFIQLAGHKVMLTHGDQLCTDDKEYQAFRSVVRNPIWQKDFLNFPISKRQKIANETKDASKASKEMKAMDIMDVNENSVLESFIENKINIMIHGHTHRPNKHHISNDQGDFTRYVLGDWSQKSAIIIKCTDENIELIELI